MKIESKYMGNPPDAGSLYRDGKRVAWLPVEYASRPERLEGYIDALCAEHDRLRRPLNHDDVRRIVER